MALANRLKRLCSESPNSGSGGKVFWGMTTFSVSQTTVDVNACLNTGMTPEESLVLYQADVESWQREADRPGNGWMEFQLLELAINAWIEPRRSLPHQQLSLFQTDRK